jgi:hypothetical protein
MRIELKKAKDGRPNLACVRDDGSRSWAKLHPFFPVHDLTHCAVESVFGFTEAFFGLVASGREIDAFQQAGAAGWLPPEAMWAECMVGLFDMERASGQLLGAAEFSAALADVLQSGKAPPFRAVTDDELGRVRVLRSTLTASWNDTAPGETLTLPFPALRV